MLNLARRRLGRGLEAKARCVTLARHTIRKRRKSSAFDAILALYCPILFLISVSNLSVA